MDYSASFEHIDGLGDKRLSLIRSVEIHELNRVVQADRTFVGFSQKPVREHVLHLLDFNSSGIYQLSYETVGTADVMAPASAVAALPAQSSTAIAVQGQGEDNPGGSGIAHFDVYVSVNGAPCGLWLPKTTDHGAVYVGETGKTYAFYSVATDYSGNQEPVRANADAQTIVQVVNTAPILTVAFNQVVDEGATVTLINSAVDNDVPANTLVWALGPNAPASARINPATGQVTWPTGEGAGPSTNRFEIVVRDNGQPALAATGHVAVIVRELNAPPVLEGITNRVVDELRTVRFQARATDTDLPANALTFSLVNPPPGATITPGGLFNWTPNRLQGPSTNVIEIRVTDDGVPALSRGAKFHRGRPRQ